MYCMTNTSTRAIRTTKMRYNRDNIQKNIHTNTKIVSFTFYLLIPILFFVETYHRKFLFVPNVCFNLRMFDKLHASFVRQVCLFIFFYILADASNSPLKVHNRPLHSLASKQNDDNFVCVETRDKIKTTQIIKWMAMTKKRGM